MNIINGYVAAPKANIGIAISRFNNFINNNLLDGAVDTLERVGQVERKNITVVWVPGAYELPLIIKILVETKKYDAVIALASIIRGVTKHFEYISRECSAGLSDVSMKNNIPVTFGILTTEDIDQAINRAGAKEGNKGSEAALSALEMVNVINIIKG
ncbi:MAG: 6,7-dimethyl-8-ribityllumazine synthase [Arsenophonus sp.]